MLKNWLMKPLRKVSVKAELKKCAAIPRAYKYRANDPSAESMRTDFRIVVVVNDGADLDVCGVLRSRR
jgi:hypothetical protein